jgi:hypothetical protein
MDHARAAFRKYVSFVFLVLTKLVAKVKSVVGLPCQTGGSRGNYIVVPSMILLSSPAGISTTSARFVVSARFQWLLLPTAQGVSMMRRLLLCATVSVTMEDGINSTRCCGGFARTARVSASPSHDGECSQNASLRETSRDIQWHDGCESCDAEPFPMCSENGSDRASFLSLASSSPTLYDEEEGGDDDDDEDEEAAGASVVT